MYSSLVKKMLRRSYKLLGYLPAQLRAPIIRSQLKLNYTQIPGVKIKVAETKEEIEQAYKILHDTYLETKLIDEDSSGLRVTKYHALPTTTLCVVKRYEKVIGTFTIIQDSIFGLPIDATSDITELRKRNSKIAEISSLAISRESGLRRGKLMFPVFDVFIRQSFWKNLHLSLRIDVFCHVLHHPNLIFTKGRGISPRLTIDICNIKLIKVSYVKI